METIAKIRAEIDKLYDEYKGKFYQWDDQYHLGLIDGLDMAERVLDALEEEPVDVGRDENIGLSIMFFLGTHVKHENSVLVRGKGEVTYKEACEWIRRNIAREKSEEPMNLDFDKAWEEYGKSKGGGAITVNVKDLARHFFELGRNAK